jgi:hypothetical protein
LANKWAKCEVRSEHDDSASTRPRRIDQPEINNCKAV